MTTTIKYERRPVLYIAGPFRGAHDYARKLNRDRAEATAHLIWSLGAVACCPHLNTANFDGSLPDAIWLDGDLELLRRCDGIVLSHGWLGSQGAKVERVMAQEWGLRIFDMVEEDVRAQVRAFVTTWQQEQAATR